MAAYGYVRGSSAEQAGDDRTSLDTQRQKVAAVGDLAAPGGGDEGRPCHDAGDHGLPCIAASLVSNPAALVSAIDSR